MVMKRTLGDIICQNTDAIEALPLNVFLTGNDLLPCNDPSRSELDFEAIARAITEKYMTNPNVTDTTSTSEASNPNVYETTSTSEATNANVYDTTSTSEKAIYDTNPATEFRADTSTSYANYVSTSTTLPPYT